MYDCCDRCLWYCVLFLGWLVGFGSTVSSVSNSNGKVLGSFILDCLIETEKVAGVVCFHLWIKCFRINDTSNLSIYISISNHQLTHHSSTTQSLQPGPTHSSITHSVHPSIHSPPNDLLYHSVTYLLTYSLELITHPPNSLTHPSIQNNHPSFQSTQQVTLISPPAPGRQQKAEM